MRAQPIKISKNPLIALSAAMMGLVATNGFAIEKPSLAENAQLIYQSRSANHAIYSYPSSVTGKVALEPEIIYVSQAYGPAIHSYEHTGSEIAVPWNAEYVDSAYGRAIYSYKGVRGKGTVHLLPIITY